MRFGWLAAAAAMVCAGQAGAQTTGNSSAYYQYQIMALGVAVPTDNGGFQIGTPANDEVSIAFTAMAPSLPSGIFEMNAPTEFLSLMAQYPSSLNLFYLGTAGTSETDISTIFSYDGVPGATGLPTSLQSSAANGRITYEYTSGDYHGGITFNGNVFSLAITPVASYASPVVRVSAGPAPEPAAWAMMLVGLGAAGVALRRRSTASLPARV